ncbi:MAG: GntR family transcriptional regulator [Phycisphaerae bacterium]|jgi:LacI family transcriptional regulator
MERIRSFSVDKSAGKSSPIYAQIHKYFRDHLISKNFSPGTRLPPINKMVTELNVGYQAVKAAMELLEDDGLIRCEPGRGKGPLILNAKSIENKSPIAFVRWSGDPIFVELGDGVRRFLHEKGLKLITIDALENVENYCNVITAPLEGVQGLILYPWDSPEYRRFVEDALKAGIHIIFADHTLHGLPVGSVSPDHFNGAYQVTNHLIETHNCPVYYIPITCLQRSSCQRRLEGWAAAMHRHSYDPEEYLWDFPLSDKELGNIKPSIAYLIEYSANVAKKLFEERNEEKICVFTINDYVAKGAFLAAEELGLQVGRQIILAGFGDLPLCTNLRVPLTSVSQSNEQVGYEAAKMLYNSIISGVKREPMHLVLPTELKIRASSANAR